MVKKTINIIRINKKILLLTGDNIIFEFLYYFILENPFVKVVFNTMSIIYRENKGQVNIFACIVATLHR